MFDGYDSGSDEDPWERGLQEHRSFEERLLREVREAKKDPKQLEIVSRKNIIRACRMGCLAFLKAMIEDEGIDMKRIEFEGEIPLVASIMNTYMGGKIPCGNTTEYLIPRVDVNAQDSEGRTALMAAMSSLNSPEEAQEMCEKLIKFSADPNIQDKDGRTALMDSILFTDSQRFLIENGADVSLRAKDGSKALMIALKYCRFDVAQILLENEADTEVEGPRRHMALCIAVEHLSKSKWEPL